MTFDASFKPANGVIKRDVSFRLRANINSVNAYQSIKTTVTLDCSVKMVSLVAPSASTLEQTKNENLGIITLKTTDQAKALFQTEDALCPIQKYELMNKDGSAITSSADLYKVLGFATRSTDEVKFNTGFVPANGVIERAVEF